MRSSSRDSLVSACPVKLPLIIGDLILAAGSVEQLQDQMEVLEEFLKDSGAVINKNKTVVLARHMDDEVAEWAKSRGARLEKSAKNLGLHVTVDQTWSTHLDMIEKKVTGHTAKPRPSQARWGGHR